MDKDTAETLKSQTDRLDSLMRGMQAVAEALGGNYRKNILEAMSGEDHTALMSEAAAECMSPDQYNWFMGLINDDPQVLNRLYRCIQKRVK
jgi:hypothetical protein